LCRALQHRFADALYQSNRLITAVQRRFGGQANIAIVRLPLTPKTRPQFKKMAGRTPGLSRRQSDQLQNSLSDLQYLHSRALYRPDIIGGDDQFSFADLRSFLSIAKSSQWCGSGQKLV